MIFVVVLKSKILPTELRCESSDTGREGEDLSVENCFSEGDGVGIPRVSTTFVGSSFHTPDEGNEEAISEGELAASEGEETSVLGSVSSKIVPALLSREGGIGGSEGTRKTAYRGVFETEMSSLVR